MSLDFPFFASSSLEDVASILRYINVSILFYCIFQCDNEAVVSIIRHCKTRNSVLTDKGSSPQSLCLRYLNARCLL